MNIKENMKFNIRAVSSIVRRTRKDIRDDSPIKQYLKGRYDGLKLVLKFMIIDYKAIK
jgi:hypothetical protein